MNSAHAIEQEHDCPRCGERLKASKAVWLELSFDTGLYYVPGSAPEKSSQGCFAFGKGCAASVLANGGRNNRIKAARSR